MKTEINNQLFTLSKGNKMNKIRIDLHRAKEVLPVMNPEALVKLHNEEKITLVFLNDVLFQLDRNGRVSWCEDLPRFRDHVKAAGLIPRLEHGCLNHTDYILDPEEIKYSATTFIRAEDIKISN